MKRFISLVIAILIAVATTTPSFAKEKAPKIVTFRVEATQTVEDNVSDAMRVAENTALRRAQQWLTANYKGIRVFSLSVSGSYYGRFWAYGFSTVTILYEEK